MNPTRTRRLFVALALVALAAGCSGRDTGTLPDAPVSTDPVIFIDDFNGVDFQFFGDGAVPSGLEIDRENGFEGSEASLRIDIPAHPNWTGGAFPSNEFRDLSGYTALTFWAKASRATTFDVVGLGNNNLGNSLYTAEWRGVDLTTAWTKYYVPIPLPAKLTLEDGMFFFADAVNAGEAGVQVWFDDIVFEDASEVTNPRPSLATRPLNALAGTNWTITGTQTTFSVEGVDQVIGHFPAYFDFTSSDETVATVSDGVLSIVGTGIAEITATYDGEPVEGVITVFSEEPDPTSAAPSPTLPPGRVISLFSNPYDDVLVDSWSTGWDTMGSVDLQIEGNDTKLYQPDPGAVSPFAAIEFTTQTIDATAMTHLHVDVWSTGGTRFDLKLVDFGADGAFGGGDDSEHTVPGTIAIDEWVSLEIPLSEFTGLASRGHLAQMLFSGFGLQRFYVDNIYFHD